MGLTIHYSLVFNGTREEATEKLKQLRNKAMDMSFVELSEIRHFIGEQCNFNSPLYNSDDDWRWSLIQAGGKYLRITPDGKLLKQGEDTFVGCYHIGIQPLEIILFRAWAGEGCEESNFGLCRYPTTIKHEGKAFSTGLGNGWHWSSFCKTQYANEHGIMNFIRCHTLIIAILDYAKELGILKRVDDEGDYYEKRDLKELVLEIGRWDKFIAGFSATLKQTFGEDNVQSEIENHPSYDRLKGVGLQHFSQSMLSQLQDIQKQV